MKVETLPIEDQITIIDRTFILLDLLPQSNGFLLQFFLLAASLVVHVVSREHQFELSHAQVPDLLLAVAIAYVEVLEIGQTLGGLA